MLCFGAGESGFNIYLLLSKSKSFTWVFLVQDCQALFIILATNHLCSSANLHAIFENTARKIPWPGENINLKMEDKVQGCNSSEGRQDNRKVTELLFKGKEVGLGAFLSKGSNAVGREQDLGSRTKRAVQIHLCSPLCLEGESHL